MLQRPRPCGRTGLWRTLRCNSVFPPLPPDPPPRLRPPAPKCSAALARLPRISARGRRHLYLSSICELKGITRRCGTNSGGARLPDTFERDYKAQALFHMDLQNMSGFLHEFLHAVTRPLSTFQPTLSYFPARKVSWKVSSPIRFETSWRRRRLFKCVWCLLLLCFLR